MKLHNCGANVFASIIFRLLNWYALVKSKNTVTKRIKKNADPLIKHRRNTTLYLTIQGKLRFLLICMKPSSGEAPLISEHFHTIQHYCHFVIYLLSMCLQHDSSSQLWCSLMYTKVFQTLPIFKNVTFGETPFIFEYFYTMQPIVAFCSVAFSKLFLASPTNQFFTKAPREIDSYWIL